MKRDEKSLDLKYVIQEENLGDRTIKQMLEHPRFKNAVMNIFGGICNAFSENNKEVIRGATSSAKKVIPDCILNYPKIILEPSLGITKGVVSEAIKNAGELRLPFPKAVILGGLQEEQFAVTTGSNKIINIVMFFVEQDSDGINVYFATNAKNAIDVITFRTWITNENMATAKDIIGDNKLLAQPILTDEQEKHFSPDIVQGLCSIALSTVTKAIYMMTLQEGSTDVLMSIPTPEESLINRKRISKGKKPLVEFRLITIDTKKKETEVREPHGTHASPRQHWRRGHWRTAPKSGKKVWIEPMLVGDEANGKIIKDYAVGHYERQHVHH